MKYLAAALIYVGFFGLIGLVCYFTQSAWPLIGLVFMPELNSTETK